MDLHTKYTTKSRMSATVGHLSSPIGRSRHRLHLCLCACDVRGGQWRRSTEGVGPGYSPGADPWRGSLVVAAVRSVRPPPAVAPPTPPWCVPSPPHTPGVDPDDIVPRNDAFQNLPPVDRRKIDKLSAKVAGVRQRRPDSAPTVSLPSQATSWGRRLWSLGRPR